MRSKSLSSCRRSAQAAAAVMAAAYYYQYHETDECRELREGYNEMNTGEKGSFEDPAARVELPTAAGSVMLDLGQISGKGGSSGMGMDPSLRGGTRGKPLRSSSTKLGPADAGKTLKRRKGGSRRVSEESMDGEDASPTGMSKVQFDVANTSSLFNKGSDEDDVPPLTAEARPTPTQRRPVALPCVPRPALPRFRPTYSLSPSRENAVCAGCEGTRDAHRDAD